jgi:hypothetical protein
VPLEQVRDEFSAPAEYVLFPGSRRQYSKIPAFLAQKPGTISTGLRPSALKAAVRIVSSLKPSVHVPDGGAEVDAADPGPVDGGEDLTQGSRG